MQFRYMLKICAVNTGNKGKGNKNCRENGEHLHDFIQSVAHPGIVDIQVVGKHFPVGVYDLYSLTDKVKQILDKRCGLFLDKVRIKPAQLKDKLFAGRIDLRR